MQRALFLPLIILAWLVVGIVGLWLLGNVTHALLVVVLAVVVTFALAPLISLLRRWLNRPRAIAAAYLVWLGSLLIINAAGQVTIRKCRRKRGRKYIKIPQPPNPLSPGLGGREIIL